MPVSDENGFEMNPALDDPLAVFASCRCRCILYYLVESGSDVHSLDDVRDHVVAHDPEASDAERVSVNLYHSALPRLDEAGVIDFDGRSKTIRFLGVRECESVLASIRKLESGE